MVTESKLSLESVTENKDNIVSFLSEMYNQNDNKDSMAKMENDEYNINYYPTNLSQEQIDKSKCPNVELGECENVLRKQYILFHSKALISLFIFEFQIDNYYRDFNNKIKKLKL